jgi:glycosyltransferase involved in cell wall biosynthesis
MGETLTVGVQGVSYPEERNITGLPFSDRVRFRRVYDVGNLMMYVQRNVLRNHRATSFFQCFHTDFGLGRVDAFHFYNTLSFTTTPWIVTFEHYLPRWNPDSVLGMRLLAQRSCRKIIAMSEFARSAQQFLLARSPELRDTVDPRMTVLLPAQKPLVGVYDEKDPGDDAVRFAFVGRDFFRKGGKEVVRAAHQLVREGQPVHLVVVSGMEFGDYASRSTEADVRETDRLLRELGDRVTLHQELSNDEVLRIFRSAHVGLLPTYDDTFGFSVLECQATATPVITTDVCALPEINDNTSGWVIPVRKNEFGQAPVGTAEDRRELSRTIEEGLYRAMREACEQPSLLRIKGEAALRRIREHHDPNDRACTLTEIYRKAISSGGER